VEVHPLFVAVVAFGISVILAPYLVSWVKLRVCSSCVVAVGYYSHDFSCRNIFYVVAVYVCKLCPCRITVCVFPTTGDSIKVVFGHHSPSSNGNSMILWMNFWLSARRALLWFDYRQLRSRFYQILPPFPFRASFQPCITAPFPKYDALLHFYLNSWNTD